MGKKKDVLSEDVKDIVEKGVEFVSTTLKLPKDLWRESKIKALNSGVTLAELTEKALRKLLKEESERK